jgi:hypothetical protein
MMTVCQCADFPLTITKQEPKHKKLWTKTHSRAEMLWKLNFVPVANHASNLERGSRMKSPCEKNSLQERLQYATRQLKKHNIEFSLKNEQTGHFHCRRKSDDKLIQFWAGTGKIMGCENRGIHNLIDLLTDCA